MADDQLALGVAYGWAVRPVDEKHTAIVFDVGSHKTGAVLENDSLSQFVGRLINEAVKVGQTRSPSFQDGEAISAVPVPVAGMAVTPGRVETEAILTVRFGNLTLALAVDAAMLRRTCTDALAVLQPDGPQKSH